MKPDHKKLPLGGPAWLRAQADEKEEMADLLPSEMFEREDKREIQGLRDAAGRMLRLEQALQKIADTADEGRICDIAHAALEA